MVMMESSKLLPDEKRNPFFITFFFLSLFLIIKIDMYPFLYALGYVCHWHFACEVMYVNTYIFYLLVSYRCKDTVKWCSQNKRKGKEIKFHNSTNNNKGERNILDTLGDWISLRWKSHFFLLFLSLAYTNLKRT